jgi:hypothetical protein
MLVMRFEIFISFAKLRISEKKTKLFGNFGFAELTFRSEMKRKQVFLLHFSHLFGNFATNYDY